MNKQSLPNPSTPRLPPKKKTQRGRGEKMRTVSKSRQKHHLLLREVCRVRLCIFLSRRFSSSASFSSGTTYVIICDTFYIRTSTEESAFSSEYGEDGIWMLVQGAKRRYGILDNVATKGVQGFGAVELGCVRWLLNCVVSCWKGKDVMLSTLIMPILPLISNLMSVYWSVMMTVARVV